MGQIGELLEKAIQIHRDFVELQTEVKHLREGIKQVSKTADEEIQKLIEENKEIIKRLAVLEADFEAAIKKSVKDNTAQAIREHLEQTGRLPSNLPFLKKPEGGGDVKGTDDL